MCPIPQNVASYKRLKEKGVSETQTDRNEYSDQFSYILQKFEMIFTVKIIGRYIHNLKRKNDIGLMLPTVQYLFIL